MLCLKIVRSIWEGAASGASFLSRAPKDLKGFIFREAAGLWCDFLLTVLPTPLDFLLHRWSRRELHYLKPNHKSFSFLLLFGPRLKNSTWHVVGANAPEHLFHLFIFFYGVVPSRSESVRGWRDFTDGSHLICLSEVNDAFVTHGLLLLWTAGDSCTQSQALMSNLVADAPLSSVIDLIILFSKKNKTNIFKETESETFQLRSEDFKANEWCVAVFAEKKTAKSVVCPHVGPQLCFFYHMDTKLWAKESHEMLNEIKKQNAASQKICFYSKKNHQSPRYYTFKRF